MNVNEQWTDETLMPFGKHKGMRLMHVPVGYLHWLWQRGHKSDPNSALGDYVRRNLAALEKENPDLIWD